MVAPAKETLEVTSSLKVVAKNSKISQNELAKICNEMGCNITQGAISKIFAYENIKSYKRVPTFPLIYVVYICKALKVKLEEILDTDVDPMVQHQIIPTITGTDEIKNTKSMVFDPEEDAFDGYIGKFHCYFYPTISSEDDILQGTLNFTKNTLGKRCDAILQFEYGEQKKSKQYTGSLIISIKQNSCYCILSNLEYGEICMLNFHHRFFVTEHNLQCRLACAITTSAGEHRRPTIHRMLITKNPLDKKLELEILKSQLLLNSKDIIIAKENLEKLELPPEISDLFAEGGAINSKEYYCFDESQIHSIKNKFGVDKNTSFAKRAEIICKIREYSVAERYNKLSSKADELIYKYLRNKNKTQ